MEHKKVEKWWFSFPEYWVVSKLVDAGHQAQSTSGLCEGPTPSGEQPADNESTDSDRERAEFSCDGHVVGGVLGDTVLPTPL